MRWSVGLMSLGFLAAGCGGPDYPETYPVTGTVTYKGKPVEGANVALVPGDPSTRSAGGMTDAEGNFSVQTYFDPQHQTEGAMPGDYAVTVSQLEKRDSPPGMTGEQQMAQYMKLGPAKSLLPKKYQAPNTSGFKVSVGESPGEPLKLELN